jgi:hypothetical protein
MLVPMDDDDDDADDDDKAASLPAQQTNHKKKEELSWSWMQLLASLHIFHQFHRHHD